PWLELQRKLLQAPQNGMGAPLHLSWIGEAQTGASLDQRAKRDPPVEAGQRRSEAKMNAMPEGQMGARVPSYVQLVGLVESLSIAVHRWNEDASRRPLRDAPISQLDVDRREAHRRKLQRRFESQRLLHRALRQRRLSSQQRQLIRVAQQRQHGVADQVHRGDEAGEQ